jgi:hypothetical protein
MKPSQRVALISVMIGTLMTAVVAVVLQNAFQLTTAYQHPGIWLILLFCWLTFTVGFFRELIKYELLEHFNRDWERTKKEGG